MTGKNHIARFGVIVWAVATIAITPAQAAEKPIGLGLYVQSVLKDSPGAARIGAEIATLKAEGVEAAQRINPELQIDVTAARDNASLEMEVEFEQPLRGSDFGVRRRYAGAVHATLSPEHKARLLDLSHEAVRAYADLWTIQERIALIDRLVRDAGRQTKAVEEAAKQGLADAAETEILTTDAAELKLQKESLEAQRKIALSSFVKLASLPYLDYRLDAPKLPPLPASAAALLKLADSETSVRAILEGRRNVAARRLAVSRADAALPEFAPRAVLTRDLTDDSSAFKLGARFVLPVWSRNQGEILRARAAFDETDSALRSLAANDYPAVLSAAWRGAVDAKSVADRYRDTVLPGWRNVQKLSEGKLRLGQASVFDLWQARSRVLEAETKNLEARKEAVEAVLSLESLAGKSFLAPPDPAQGDRQ